MNKQEFDDIMDMAIAEEIETYQFYRDVAEKLADQGMKVLFQDFAEEENQHIMALQDIKSKDIEDFSFCEGSEFTISQTCGGKDYQLAETIETPRLSADMRPEDAIALAIKKEEEAMILYAGLADASNDPAEKHIFTELSKMEEAHKVKMEDIYTNAAFGEIW